MRRHVVSKTKEFGIIYAHEATYYSSSISSIVVVLALYLEKW